MPFYNREEKGRPVKIKDEGLTLVNNVASIDLVGDGVLASSIGDDVTQNIPGTGLTDWLLNGNTLGSKKTLGSIDNYGIGFITNNTERLTILNNGNVGIGTTNPGDKLDISGSMRITASSGSYLDRYAKFTQSGNDGSPLSLSFGGTGTASYLDIQQSHPYYGFLMHKGSVWGGQGIQGTNNDFVISTGTTTQDIVFNGGNFQSANEIMRLKGTGNVGIGTTNPTEQFMVFKDTWRKFSVSYPTIYAARLNIGVNGYIEQEANGGYLTLAQVYSTAGSNIRFTLGGNERMRIMQNGNVGIGTSTPTAKLHILGGLKIDSSNPVIDLIDSNGSDWKVSLQDNHLSFLGNDGATEYVRFKNGGNVGIGTASPTAKLHVNGNTIRLDTAKTPSSASDTGNQGDIAWDSNYIYVCVATDTWKRAALASW